MAWFGSTKHRDQNTQGLLHKDRQSQDGQADDTSYNLHENRQTDFPTNPYPGDSKHRI